MLTGDRVETGLSTAISAGLKSKKDDLYFITDQSINVDVSLKLIEFRKRSKKTILIIDGKSLDVVLQNDDLVELFY